ncbi:nucleotide-diphospho-sugar transferase [Luteolibacter sp. Populi]|uniref:nucleotide-diphospho-sugar transferase n=1 Tax=Luteolibacter sp. Populi TaxID=3230487 RepID=UPI0034668937
MILFNRPDLAEQVFERVRQARPARLYLAVDGARDSRPPDLDLTARCRALAEKVDWPCELKTRFSECNQGCGRGPSNAITWFFSHEKAGIILEDDCLPEATFFPFCAEMLAHYADDPAVMHINGNNFAPAHPERIYDGHSFGFARYAQAWGWASWARAWQHFDYEATGIREATAETFNVAGVESLRREAHRDRVVSTLEHHHHDVWDYQWQYAVMKRRGLCISPAVNQISNLGFGDDATHTTDSTSFVARAKTGRLNFPLKYPPTAESPAVNRLYANHMLGEVARYRKKAFKRWLRGLFGLNKEKAAK